MPVFTPFICHWYIGVVPPFDGIAVKVVGAPRQLGFVSVEIDTPAINVELISTAAEGADAQPFNVTTSV